MYVVAFRLTGKTMRNQNNKNSVQLAATITNDLLARLQAIASQNAEAEAFAVMGMERESACIRRIKAGSDRAERVVKSRIKSAAKSIVKIARRSMNHFAAVQMLEDFNVVDEFDDVERESVRPIRARKGNKDSDYVAAKQTPAQGKRAKRKETKTMATKNANKPVKYGATKPLVKGFRPRRSRGWARITATFVVLCVARQMYKTIAMQWFNTVVQSVVNKTATVVISTRVINPVFFVVTTPVHGVVVHNNTLSATVTSARFAKMPYYLAFLPTYPGIRGIVMDYLRAEIKFSESCLDGINAVIIGMCDRKVNLSMEPVVMGKGRLDIPSGDRQLVAIQEIVDKALSTDGKTVYKPVLDGVPFSVLKDVEQPCQQLVVMRDGLSGVDIVQVVRLQPLASRKYESYTEKSPFTDGSGRYSTKKRMRCYRLDPHTALVNKLCAGGAELWSEQFMRASLQALNQGVHNNVLGQKTRGKEAYFGFQCAWIQNETLKDGHINLSSALVIKAARAALRKVRDERSKTALEALIENPRLLDGVILTTKRYPTADGDCMIDVVCHVYASSGERAWQCNSFTAKLLNGDYDGDAPECGTDKTNTFRSMVERIEYNQTRDDLQYTERLPWTLFTTDVNTVVKKKDVVIDAALQSFKRIEIKDRLEVYNGMLVKSYIETLAVLTERLAIIAIHVVLNDVDKNGMASEKLREVRKCAVQLIQVHKRQRCKKALRFLVHCRDYNQAMLNKAIATLVANVVYSSLLEVNENIFDSRKVEKLLAMPYNPADFVDGLVMTGAIDWEGAAKGKVITPILQMISKYCWQWSSGAPHRPIEVVRLHPIADAIFGDRQGWKDGRSLSMAFLELCGESYDSLYDFCHGEMSWDIPEGAPKPEVTHKRDEKFDIQWSKEVCESASLRDTNGFIHSMYKKIGKDMILLPIFLMEKGSLCVAQVPADQFELAENYLSGQVQECPFIDKRTYPVYAADPVDEHGCTVIRTDTVTRVIPAQISVKANKPKGGGPTELVFAPTNFWYELGYMAASVYFTQGEFAPSKSQDTKPGYLPGGNEQRNRIQSVITNVRGYIQTHEPVNVHGERMYRDMVKIVYRNDSGNGVKKQVGIEVDKRGYDVLSTSKSSPGSCFLRQGLNGRPELMDAVCPMAWSGNETRSNREAMAVIRQTQTFINPKPSRIKSFNPEGYSVGLSSQMTRATYVVSNCRGNRGGADSVFGTIQGMDTLRIEESVRQEILPENLDAFRDENPDKAVVTQDIRVEGNLFRRRYVLEENIQEDTAGIHKGHLGFGTKAMVAGAGIEIVVSTNNRLHTRKNVDVDSWCAKGDCEKIDLIIPADTVIGKQGSFLLEGIAERLGVQLDEFDTNGSEFSDFKTTDAACIQALEVKLVEAGMPFDGKLNAYLVTPDNTLVPLGRMFVGACMYMRTAHKDSDVWSKAREGASSSMMQQVLLGDYVHASNGAEQDRARYLFNFYSAALTAEAQSNYQFPSDEKKQVAFDYCQQFLLECGIDRLPNLGWVIGSLMGQEGKPSDTYIGEDGVEYWL